MDKHLLIGLLMLSIMLMLLGISILINNNLLINSSPTGSVVGVAGPAETPSGTDQPAFGEAVTGSSGAEEDSTDSG